MKSIIVNETLKETLKNLQPLNNMAQLSVPLQQVEE